MGIELWGYILGICISLNNECTPHSIILDFETEYTCHIHALLTTHLHQIELMEDLQNYEIYASYSGCHTHQKLMELAGSYK